MTFPNGGQRDEYNPNRQVGRESFNPSVNRFVGRYLGGIPLGAEGGPQGERSFFSAESTGGGSTDSHGVIREGHSWRGMHSAPEPLTQGAHYMVSGSFVQPYNKNVHYDLPGAPKEED